MNPETQSGGRQQTPHELEMALVERAKRDTEAFGELYETWSSPIYRFLLRRLREPASAEDLTAEVFINALRGIGGYRDLGKPLRAWLFQIAANTVASHQRRARPFEDLEAQYALAAEGPELEDLVAQREDVRRAWALVGRLPEGQRLALQLRFGEDLPYRVIAQLTGRSEGATKLLVHRGVRTLRAQLADEIEPGRRRSACARGRRRAAPLRPVGSDRPRPRQARSGAALQDDRD